jgi:hypothetical protein
MFDIMYVPTGYVRYVTGRPRPVSILTTHMIRKRTKRNHAMFDAVPATPVKPRTAAINANTKKVIAQLSIWDPPFC